jgi:hypothetical protein
LAKKNNIGAVLTLKDNMSAVMKGVRKEQSQFRKDVQETRKSIERTYKKKHDLRVNHTAAAKKIKELKKDLDPLRKKVVTAIAHKDMIKGKIKEKKNELKTLGKMIASPVVKIKDQVTGGISKLKGKLTAFAKSPIGIGLVAGAVAAGGLGIGALKMGADLEKQNIAMEHFIGKNNPSMGVTGVKRTTTDFMRQLRENANATPFETGEVITAGTRALGITGGNTKDAMELVKVAEDMAALTPGKTIQDAMEALADAKNGEMERLKEFNAKVSAEDFKKLGFKGVVDQRLKSQFEGGAEKLATSGSGLVSTITGKLKTNLQDTGLKMLDQLKPALQGAITLIDMYSPSMEKIGEKVASGVGTAISYIGKFSGYVKAHMPQIRSTIAYAANLTKPAFDLIANGATLAYNVFNWAFPGIKAVIGSVWNFVKPVLEGLSELIGWVADKTDKLGKWFGKKSGKVTINAVQETRSSRRGGVEAAFASGINRVPRDMNARIHKDEAVIPAKYNPFNPNTRDSRKGNIINIYISGVNKTIKEIVNELVPELQLAIENR